ncbi:hypothetical protein SGLAM104S_06998 [Streptomyces glaucescens]
MIISPAEYARLMREVVALIAAEDIEPLVPGLVALGEMIDGTWGLPEGRQTVEALRTTSVPFRTALLRTLLDRCHAPDTPPAARRSLVVLLHNIARMTPATSGSPETRAALVDLYSRQDTEHDTRQLIHLAEGELADGRDLPGEFVAVLRRSQMVAWRRSSELDAFLRRITAPALNPGEAWADRALADLAGLGPDWQRLLAHAATATAPRPPATWERTGRALIDALGADAVRERLLSWLSLVAGRVLAPCWWRTRARTSTTPSTRSTPPPCAAWPGCCRSCPRTRETPGAPARGCPAPVGSAAHAPYGER